jgi:DNA-binding NarL/FixJ family response regulator
MHDTPKIRKRACFFCEAAWAGISQALSLSEREVQIFQRLILAESEREAAATLETSPRTVRTHLERLRRKLGLHNRTELIVRIFDAHFDWLVQARIPSGCRLNGGRLTGIRNAARTNRMHDTQETHCYFCQPAWEGISRQLDLTERECEVLQCIIRDRGVHGAANDLGASISTVQTHEKRIHKKLGVESRTALIVKLFDAHNRWRWSANPPPTCCHVNMRLA